MGAVFKKEFRSYFVNMTGYIAIALILLMTGIFTYIINIKGMYPSFEQVLTEVALILLLAVPILAMKSFAEEKSQKTELLLYSLPLTSFQIVMGKYLAMVAVLGIPTVMMLLIPVILSFYGTVSFAAAYASILAFFLLMCAMVAICMFMSSLTESQIIAAVLGIAALLACYLSSILVYMLPDTALASFIAFTVLIFLLALVIYYFTKNYWAAFTAGVVVEAGMLIFYIADDSKFANLFPKAVSSINMFDKLAGFVGNQLIDLTVYVYYLSIAVVFFVLTMQMVEKKRYN